MFCKPPHPVYIVLFRGDDTDFVGNQEIIVKITTERNISGCKAYFKYMGNIQTFDEIPEDKELHLVFSREQTKDMPLGTWDAELYLIDENGKRMTVNNRIHMLVTNSVREAYFPDDPQSVSVVISANKYIEDAEVSADGKTLTLTKKDGTEVSFSGGGSGGGTNDYNDLENKPSINGTTLTGNVNLATSEQLSLKADKATTLAGYGITDAVPLVEDSNGEKTAVTIGTRVSGGTVGQYSIANGNNVTALGVYSHAEGNYSTASGHYSHAEGRETTASGDYSHAEGNYSTASGHYSHAEGNYSTASGHYSHAEGNYSTALGEYSHAEGGSTTASGVCSHADGYFARAKDDYAYSWNGNYKTDIQYDSHGKGTFNINPVGGLDGFYIGDKKLSEVMSDGVSDKADKTSLAPEYSQSSAYAVGAFVYHDGNIYQCKTAIADGGEAWNAAHWELRKLDDFFTNSNSLLNGRLAYSRNATGLKDRAFNALTFDGTEYNLSTALAAVSPTASGQPRDLLIVATATAATTISFTAGTIKGDKPTIDGSGTWLITLTEYASGVWYCRQIKMEDAA